MNIMEEIFEIRSCIEWFTELNSIFSAVNKELQG